jgi:hypothetical protein
MGVPSPSHLHRLWLWALQDAPNPTPPFLASGLPQHSRGRQQAVLLPLLQTLLIVASLVARWGCCSVQWWPRHLVDDGRRSGQTPEVGECPAAAVQQSLPMLHQSPCNHGNGSRSNLAKVICVCHNHRQCHIHLSPSLPNYNFLGKYQN